MVVGQIHCTILIVYDHIYSKLEGNPRFQFESRGEIYIKGLGDRQTYFVELAEGNEVLSLPHEEDILTTTEDTSILTECQLRKMPTLTRQPNVSPFIEEEKKGASGLHRPTVVDMVKPQAPLEEAWSTLTPPHSTRTSTDSSKSYQQGTPRNAKITPSMETDGTALKCNQAVFIGSNPSNAAATPNHESPTKTDKHKSKCVVS